MKKILLFLNVVLFGALLASCNMNEIPSFDDKDAFVSFGSTSYKVTEDAGVISIPVSVGSIDVVANDVAFEIVDGSAKSGVNYKLVEPASGTLSFEAGERVKEVKVEIINREGIFSGDVNFSLNITNPGSLNISNESSIKVTIEDLDHPLSAILGTYTMSGASFFGGTVQYDMTIFKDEKDLTKVWIANIGSFGDGAGFYGIVNDDLTEISVPCGQISATDNAGSNGDGNLYLYPLDADGNGHDTGNMIITVSDGGKTLTMSDLAPGLNAGGLGFYEALAPPVTGTKK